MTAKGARYRLPQGGAEAGARTPLARWKAIVENIPAKRGDVRFGR